MRKLIEAELAGADEVLVHMRDVLYPLGLRAAGDDNPITKAIAYLETGRTLAVSPTRERSCFARVTRAAPRKR